jgi:signal peptidase I
MGIDFTLILSAGTALIGAVWISFRARAAFGPEVSARPGPPDTRVYQFSRALFPVLLVVLAIRSFAFEPYRIPSPSMVPTLEVGDFIFVNKAAYGLRVPVFDRRLLRIGTPDRGDVVVFRLPSDNSISYIKRVVGLPGDRITYRDHKLSINGWPVDVELVLPGEGSLDGPILGAETLGGVTHPIVHQPLGHQRAVQDFEATVPARHYFMLGDNRDNSQDSRSPLVGFVPEDNLVGKAVLVWLNFNDWSRAGRGVL